MFGMLTLHGVQVKNIFVADNGQEFRIANSWVPPRTQVEKYVLLQKRDDDYWHLIRAITISVKDL
jgi:hypothetical protein